jgi:Region found in RelA / SpoT proteins
MQADAGGGPRVSAAQAALRETLGLVIPFQRSTFMTRHTSHSVGDGNLPTPMRVADAAASALMGELLVEGVGAGFSVQVQGRIKSLASTARKMRSKGVPLEAVYDGIALRVILSDAPPALASEAIRACYLVSPVVFRIWRRVEIEYDDYIARPKSSGYRSIHMAVRGPGGVPLEVQARTSSMHHDAEYGPASHWAYKARMRAAASRDDGDTDGGGAATAPPGSELGVGGQRSHGAARRDDGSGGGSIDSKRIVALRAALEWGDVDAAGPGDVQDTGPSAMGAAKRELYQMTNAGELLSRVRADRAERAIHAAEGAARAPGSAKRFADAGADEIQVMIHPGGMHRVPSGSTAGDVVRTFGRIDLGHGVGGASTARQVNVNNQLVAEDTALSAGDLVVLSADILENV